MTDDPILGPMLTELHKIRLRMRDAVAEGKPAMDAVVPWEVDSKEGEDFRLLVESAELILPLTTPRLAISIVALSAYNAGLNANPIKITEDTTS
jgi:hypothetical protein